MCLLQCVSHIAARPRPAYDNATLSKMAHLDTFFESQQHLWPLMPVDRVYPAVNITRANIFPKKPAWDKNVM